MSSKSRNGKAVLMLAILLVEEALPLGFAYGRIGICNCRPFYRLRWPFRVYLLSALYAPLPWGLKEVYVKQWSQLLCTFYILLWNPRLDCSLVYYLTIALYVIQIGCSLAQQIWLAKAVLLYHFSIWNSCGFYCDWKLKVETRLSRRVQNDVQVGSGN